MKPRGERRAPDVEGVRRRRRWAPRRLKFGGLVVALVFFVLSMTPTLLPRGPVFQALIGGLAAAGYGIGVLGSLTWRYYFPRPLSRQTLARARWTLAVVAVIGMAAAFAWFVRWQDKLRVLMEVAPLPWSGFVVIGVLTPVVFVVFLGVGRLWMHAVRWVGRQVNRVAPPRVSALVGVVVVLALTVGLLNGVVTNAVMSSLSTSFKVVDSGTRDGIASPTSALRSGGAGSLASWDSLGRQGRSFVAGGPTQQKLSEFSGRPAAEPIRVYSGLGSADGIQAQADLVVAELVRTGAFDRAVIGVVTTTGSGWINESSAAAIEYLNNGDSALASMQYSYLSSPVSFLVDASKAKQAGRALFDAVYEKRKTLPPSAHRPKVVVYGESLGSFGGEAAFSGVQDMQARSDGVLFVGPPSSNELWGELVAQRDRGTPEWLPVYRDGVAARFVARPADLARPSPDWPAPRVVYLQHPSDPITWWSPSLLFRKPDWLREPRGYDVLSSTRWYPIVTFLQLSADMAVSNDVPEGHGHTFVTDFADTWAAILQPEGWTPSDTARLRTALAEAARQ